MGLARRSFKDVAMARRFGGGRVLWGLLVLVMMALAVPSRAAAAAPPTAQAERLRQETMQAVKGRLSGALAQYCKDACVIVDVRVDLDEQLGESDDLGFEGVSGSDEGRNLYVARVQVDLQVDDRVTAVNRDRLLTIFRNTLQPLGTVIDIIWKPVTVPQIGTASAREEQLRHLLEQKVAQAVDKVFETYCPETCVLANVAVDGRLVTPDEAAGLPPEELVRDRAGAAILKVDHVDVDVTMDSAMAPEERTRITALLKAKTKFASPLSLEVTAVPFPESFARRQEKDQRQSSDPYGLGKLREMLKLFRELAGTKEILTTNSSKDQSTAETRAQTSSKDAATTDVASHGLNPWQMAAIAALLLALLGLIWFVVQRYGAASRDAKLMMLAAANDQQRQATATGEHAVGLGGQRLSTTQLSETQRREMSQRLRCDELREELTKIFMEQPRVAKETFSRLLLEEGVEETARFVHIFGQMVVFELLGDPNLHRDLTDLSEYYHKSSFSFSPEEELRLLTALRTRVTANEIRLLTRRQSDRFDFLHKLDANQLFNLIVDEKPQVQSIVLTQLDHKRRRAVFELYKGDHKVDLLRELSRADSLPKEFLANVAKVMQKKVASRPEFDTEHLRSSDILLELLEKSDLSEQRALMQNLMATNIEAARAIKLKLVTLDILPYLKDGHLLEIVMGLERDDLLTFLSGTRDNIRALILGKAPDELAESWNEDLANFKAASEQNYRIVEMQIIARIRHLATNGVINIVDINDMIFGKNADAAPVPRRPAQGAPAMTVKPINTAA